MVIRVLYFLVPFLIGSGLTYSQSFKFAFLSDTHIGVNNSEADLKRVVEDINADTSLKFVIISGDITELGNDSEVLKAKHILSELDKPLYIETGNHDANWSPNAGRIFNKEFGPGRFSFFYNGYLFIGTNSGPVMQHKSPGQVPREDILWMDSILNDERNKEVPIIYINHYPQDSTQKNWFEAIDRLKKRNIQLIMVGHGHLNTKLIFEDIPGIMGRSSLRDLDSVAAYNIVTINNGEASFEERIPGTRTKDAWAKVNLFDRRSEISFKDYPRPSYEINKAFPIVKKQWQFEDEYDIGAGMAVYKNLLITANSGGEVFALDAASGQKKWLYKTSGKIYSTPAVSAHYVVIGSTDSIIYCLNAVNGKLVWKYKTLKPIVASPVIRNGTIYIGGSDGLFRAINLATGRLKWEFSGVKDFVMTKPLLYNDNLYFGSWGNEFYALNASSGLLIWKWSDSTNNRMISPAGARPVGAHGKVFLVAPDNYITVFQASTGKIIWRKKLPSVKVRESIGLASDSSLFYVKTTDGKLVALPASGNETQPTLNENLQIGYDVNATPIIEDNGLIYVPSNSGVISAVDRKTGKLIWKHKVSNSNITAIKPVNPDQIIVSTVDGKITSLKFNPH